MVSDRVAYAKGICAGCPVLVHCRIWSIESELECGVAGGLTEAERRYFILKHVPAMAEQLAFWDSEGQPCQEPTPPVEATPAPASSSTRSILGQAKLPL